MNVTSADSVNEETFQTKSAELKAEATRVARELDGLGEVDPQRGESTLAIFEL